MRSKDRRRVPRLKERLHVTHSVIPNGRCVPVFFGETETIDIGQLGMSLHAKEGIETGRLMQLSIRFPHFPHPILMLGKVTWMNGAENGSGAAGVKFIGGLPAEIEPFISRCVTLDRSFA